MSREVSLLPRHWAWLAEQRGGASAALRRLIEAARRKQSDADAAKAIYEASSRIMWALAGNWPGFEEASRALFAKDRPRFDALTEGWPSDVRRYLGRRLDEAAALEDAASAALS